MTSSSVPQYDIVIVGAGPVGLMLSTLLARWGYRIRHIDNRPEPTTTGRADGIQPRSLDLLRNMGLKSAIMAKKPARVHEVAFWDPPKEGTSTGIQRTGTWPSCPNMIDARYPFTALLHQGYIERVFLDDLATNGVSVVRPWTITDFTSNEAANPEYPVEVKLEHIDGAAHGQETVRAKYLFGGEGARSFVRQKLGIQVHHKDPIAYVWGVMDGVVKTDFPDIKMKCTIHSTAGSIMVIPRENNMVRLYIQIASSTDPDWNPRKTATAEEMQASAKKILAPYSIEWERVEWFSVYPIGQGISEKYTLDHRVFLGGDACHTHSPKAGQGMNTAFLDAQNLAWKIHLVEQGLANRDLLHTYEYERKAVAESLLAFDNKYAKLFSQKPPSAGTVVAALADGNNTNAKTNGNADADDNQFVKTFKESCEFTSGYGVKYQPSSITWSPQHPTAQLPAVVDHTRPDTASKLRPGHLLINADVTRVVDANVVHLEQEIPLNGAFRIFVFAGNAANSASAATGSAATALRDLETGLRKRDSFFSTFQRPDVQSVSHHEQDLPHSLLYTFCIIFASHRPDVEITRDVPGVLARYRDHVYADDRPDMRVLGARASAHAKMGFDADQGGVVVVRPDGYVGLVAKLVEGSGTVDLLNGYFGSFCTKPLEQPASRL